MEKKDVKKVDGVNDGKVPTDVEDIDKLIKELSEEYDIDNVDVEEEREDGDDEKVDKEGGEKDSKDDSQKEDKDDKEKGGRDNAVGEAETENLVFGNKGDDFFYIVVSKSSDGKVSSVKILQADDTEVLVANEGDLGDIKSFIIKAIDETGVESIMTSVVDEFDLFGLNKEESAEKVEEIK